MKFFRTEGVFVSVAVEGHQYVIRYSDFGQQSSKVVDDGECVITEDQQDVKRKSCLRATGIGSLEKAVFGRGDAAVGQCHISCRLGDQQRPGSR